MISYFIIWCDLVHVPNITQMPTCMDGEYREHYDHLQDSNSSQNEMHLESQSTQLGIQEQQLCKWSMHLMPHLHLEASDPVLAIIALSCKKL